MKVYLVTNADDDKVYTTHISDVLAMIEVDLKENDTEEEGVVIWIESLEMTEEEYAALPEYNG